MIPVREQNKAKETDVRPEVDGGGRGTGEARKGDMSWQAEQRQEARTWVERGMGMYVRQGPRETNQVEPNEKDPLSPSCPCL